MSLSQAFVNIAANTTAFEAACRRAVEAMRPLQRSVVRWRRAIIRDGYTPGDRHIERIAKDCLGRRLDTVTTARRLMVASDIAAVLDREPSEWGERR